MADVIGPFNGLIVRYHDADGKRHRTTIEDVDPANPANVHKIKRWAVIESTAATRASARTIGEAWLREHNAGLWTT